MRVLIARALTASPRLIVIDEPTIGLNGLERDGILELLCSLADEGIAILSSTSQGTGMLGAHRVLALSKADSAELEPELTTVTDLDDLSRRRHGRETGQSQRQKGTGA